MEIDRRAGLKKRPNFSKNTLFSPLGHSYLARGYTLLELLIAASLIGVVVSVAGYAMVLSITKNQKSSANSTISYNINRAAEFIQEEIRAANYVESNVAAAVSSISGFTLPTGATPILILSSSGGDSIVYYTQTASKPWVGPNAIYRWGYPLDADGRYDTTKSPSSEILVDNVDNRAATPQCPTGWQSTTSSSNTNRGFSACVRNNRLVEFSLNATVTQAVGATMNYGTQTSSYARSNNNIVDITFEVLGGSAQCSSTSPEVPMDTQITITANGTPIDYTLIKGTPLDLFEIPASAKIDVTTTAYWQCSSIKVVSTKTPNVQVRALRNGDSIPSITPFGNQSTIDLFLRKYIQSGKIVLPDNQIIYLFEMYGSDPNASYFDLQDNVVLATIKVPKP